MNKYRVARFLWLTVYKWEAAFSVIAWSPDIALHLSVSSSVINTLFVVVLKAGTNPYFSPYPTHETGPDANRPMYGSKECGYDLGVFCFVGHRICSRSLYANHFRRLVTLAFSHRIWILLLTYLLISCAAFPSAYWFELLAFMNNYIKVLKSKHNHYDMIKQDQLNYSAEKKSNLLRN